MKQRNISYFDSIQANSGTDVLEKIREYLQFLHNIKMKSGVVNNEVDFSTFTLKPNPKDLPQQNNKFDCGPYCLLFSNLIARNQDILGHYDIKALRKEMRDELLLDALY